MRARDTQAPRDRAVLEDVFATAGKELEHVSGLGVCFEPDAAAVACARTRLGWICFAPLALAKFVLVAGARFLDQGGNRAIRYVYWPLHFDLVWMLTLLLTMLAAK